MEPQEKANYQLVGVAGALYAALSGVIGYALVAMNHLFPATASAGATDLLKDLFVDTRVVLFCAFVSAYFSGVVGISLAAVRGGLGAATFVQATTITLLNCLGGLLLLLVARIACVTPSCQLPVALNFVLIMTIALGMLPTFMLMVSRYLVINRLGGIEGLGYLDRMRLAGHGVNGIQNLARANPAILYINSGIDAYRLVDWMGQAQLHFQYPDAMPRLRAIHVRTIFDLVSASHSTRPEVLRAILPSEKQDAEIPFPDVVDHVESQSSYRALLEFKRIIDTAHQDLMAETPAVLGGMLEQRVTSAVEAAMFGLPLVRYNGFVKFDLISINDDSKRPGRWYEAHIQFVGSKPSETGWQDINIWEGRHEDNVEFRIRFDSDAAGFDSTEALLSVPSNGQLTTHVSKVHVSTSSNCHVWATVIQGERTIQVIEISVGSYDNS